MPAIKGKGGRRPNSGPAKTRVVVVLGAKKIDKLRLYCTSKRRKIESIGIELFHDFLQKEDVKEVIKHQEELREIARAKMPPRPPSKPRKKL